MSVKIDMKAVKYALNSFAYAAKHFGETGRQISSGFNELANAIIIDEPMDKNEGTTLVELPTFTKKPAKTGGELSKKLSQLEEAFGVEDDEDDPRPEPARDSLPDIFSHEDFKKFVSFMFEQKGMQRWTASDAVESLVRAHKEGLMPKSVPMYSPSEKAKARRFIRRVMEFYMKKGVGVFTYRNEKEKPGPWIKVKTTPGLIGYSVQIVGV